MEYPFRKNSESRSGRILSRSLRLRREDLGLMITGGSLAVLLLITDGGGPVRKFVSGVASSGSSCPEPPALIQYRASAFGEELNPPIMQLLCPPRTD